MTCICGHDVHAPTEPTVCKELFCNCEQYVESTGDAMMIAHWDQYIRDMEHVTEQVRWILTNLKYTRNLINDDFVDFFISRIGGRKYETIRRTKQKLAEDHHELYGKFKCPETETAMALKQLGIEKWVIAQ